MRFCTRLTALRVIAPFNLRLFFLVESMRLAQVDRQEALGKLDTIVLLVSYYAFGGGMETHVWNFARRVSITSFQSP